ncbi:adenylate/guanylate cyclase domain-containing protein [Sedimentitalea nanhaiensis]|nr:FlgO family outer membrane protein [Sedimentitalea nanhaiensis]
MVIGQTTARHLAQLAEVSTAVLFMDIVDSVRLIEADETGVVARWLSFVDELKADLQARTTGRIVKRMGDGLLLEFPSVEDAITTAFHILDRVSLMNTGLAPAAQIQMRMGMHVGKVIRSPERDIFGKQVNLAARLMTLARAGQIVTSADVRDAVTDGVHADFEDLGECYLKNLAHPVRAFLVHPQGTSLQTLPMLVAEDLLPTIAVIPFTPKSRSERQIALGEIIAEDIISALSRSTDLHVISRLSSAGFNFSAHSLKAVGQALSADFVLSGTYVGDDRNVTLNVELADVRSGRVIWSQDLTNKMAMLLGKDGALQSLAYDIHQAIVATEMHRAQSKPMPTLESYSILMGAVALMHRLSRRDFDYAGELLRHLIERVPNAPEPYAWMARWHVLKVQQGWADSVERETKRALDRTQTALRIDPLNVPALVSEGFALTNLKHDLEEALDRYDHALEINPNEPTGRSLRGMLHGFQGKGELAVRDTERAMHLAPLDPNRFFFLAMAAGASMANEDYSRALELTRQSLRLNRMHTSTLRMKAVAEMRLGREEEGRQTASKLLKLQPGLTVDSWKKGSPSARYPVGQHFAQSLKEAGIPEN